MATTPRPAESREAIEQRQLALLVQQYDDACSRQDWALCRRIHEAIQRIAVSPTR